METGRAPDGRGWSALIAVWFVVYSNGLLFFVARRGLDLPGTWEGPVLRPAIVLSTLVGVGLVVLDAQRLDGERLRPVPWAPFVGATLFGAWAAASSAWSLDAEISLWWGLVYTALPCVAWVMADARADVLRTGLLWGSGLILAASFVVLVARTSWAVDINDDWRGVMTNRNGFAPICALAIFTGIASSVDRHRRLGVLVAIGGLIGLLGSGSRTAWLAFGVGLGAATVLVVARRAHLDRPRRWIPPAAGGLLVGGVATVVGGVVVLWDESTFAQRRTIWDLVGDYISDAPVIGNGFAAFWQVPELHTDELLQRGSAHGSVPEILLGTGVIGLGLWLVVVGVALAGVVRATWRTPDMESWLWTAVVGLLVVENLTESFVLWFSYNWILLIAAALRFGGRQPRSRAAASRAATASLSR